MTRLAFDICKRILDIIGATFLGIALLPVMVGIGIVIRLVDGTPILFKQLRPGKDAVPFMVIKFRTMEGSTSEKIERSGSARVTKLGLQLRRFSLDELPQLWNILKGEMSFVGPRPLLSEYLPLYDSHQARRHEVRPGLTGLAQVSGRNNLTWEQKFTLDIEYVDNRSIELDMRILLRSMRVVVFPQGITPSWTEWVTPFKGTRKESKSS